MQGEEVASPTKGSRNRGGGGPGSRPKQLLLARQWSRPWGTWQRWNKRSLGLMF